MKRKGNGPTLRDAIVEGREQRRFIVERYGPDELAKYDAITEAIRDGRDATLIAWEIHSALEGAIAADFPADYYTLHGDHWEEVT